ncbi:dipeptidase [Jiangella asiatica]|uniref:Membrane dipeptidase n=1 Tax=Jiangella asiatica TaxID=2530372 RepID=A0A4R5DSB0_9ACTN|nr:dipeptidase [Jiangella asiatica]TDE13995.1 membrane dipeptidase [Jiangella asiatica]
MPARDLHDTAVVVDGTCPGYYWMQNVDAWRAGGVTCCVVTVVAFEDVRQAATAIAGLFRFLRERRDQLVLATTVDDIRAAKAAGELAVVLQFQGTSALGYEVDLVEYYWRLGVRVVQLTYNQRGPVGDGCEEPGDAGLSAFGRKVVAELNRLGMLVDVSHTGERTSLDAVEVSTAPVVASHSNPAALHPSARNISDELIEALAASGGLVGINGFSAFLGDADGDGPGLDRFVDHLVYVADLVGIEHVALGLDYTIRDAPRELYDQYVRDGMWSADTYPPPPWSFPSGLDTAAEFPKLTERLLERGFGEADVRAVLGENWLRVFGTVWGSGATQETR